MPVQRFTRAARSAAAALVAVAVGLAPVAAAQPAPNGREAPAPTSAPSTPGAPSTRPVARRLTWDRVRVNAELARREAQAQRELQAANARHAATPRDPEAVRALRAAQDKLARMRTENEKDRNDLGGEFPLEKAPYLGVATSPAPAVLRKQLRLPDGVGLLVDYVDPGSPAQSAGLQAYDVAVRLNDQILVNPQQLAVLVRTFEAGDEVRLTAVREGKETVLTVKLEQREVKALQDVVFGSQPTPDASFGRKRADNPEAVRPLGPGDQVLVTMREFGGAGLQTIELVKVSTGGEIRAPFLKKLIRVGGLSPAEAQKAIVEAYRAENVIDAANVSVRVIPVPKTDDPFSVGK